MTKDGEQKLAETTEQVEKPAGAPGAADLGEHADPA
jgi:hypothetical protein